MSHHFTRSTVSVEFYCAACKRRTQHRIDDRRKGPCLACIARLEAEHEKRKAAAYVAPEQEDLF